MWLVSFKQHSVVHGEVGKSATSMGLRAPAGRFDAAKGDDGRRAVSSSPGREPWTAGSSGGMPCDAEEGIEVEMLPLILSLAPCGGAGCCPRPPVRFFLKGCVRRVLYVLALHVSTATATGPATPTKGFERSKSARR